MRSHGTWPFVGIMKYIPRSYVLLDIVHAPQASLSSLVLSLNLSQSLNLI
jgi:hypothetical protein